MAVDGLIIHQELKTLSALLPAYIHKITQPSDSEILLTLRCEGHNHQLMLCVHSQFNRLNLTRGDYPRPELPSAFVMLLRKHLDNGLLSAIEQSGLDRCVRFTVEKNNEIGERKTAYLYLELMGKYANLILCNENNVILDALKRIPPYENTKRIIFSGAQYEENPRPQRQDPLLTKQVSLESPLLQQFEGFSPLLAIEVEYRLTHSEKFAEIMAELQSSSDLYFYPESQKYHVIPLKHLNEKPLRYPLNEGFDRLYADVQDRMRVEQLTGNLDKFVKAELRRNNNKLPKLEAAYQEACDCDKWRQAGDLIFSNLALLQKGMKSVELYDYQTGVNIVIELDPKLDPKRNGQKCYKQYRKGKNGQNYLSQQLQLTREEIEYFTSLSQQLALADLVSANEIKEELIKNSYLRASSSKRRKKKTVLPNYSTYNCEGLDIHVGHNNLQNDYLSFKLAHKEDTWFHAQKFHGAHVIAKSSKLSETQIRCCANLAAYFSQGRFSSSVPVDYCQVKHLKKIPNSRLGLVSISQYQTIFIDPLRPDQ